MPQKTYIAGHSGMVGSAVLRRLEGQALDLITATHDQVDLTDQTAVETFLGRTRPDVVIMCAARVGGILANDTYPAEFLYENLAMATNVIDAAFRHGVQRLLYLGSTCIYPREAPQPLCEDHLLTGPLEPTNEGYAIAKIAGLKLCQYYRKQYGVTYHSVMPTNLYGPGDTYDQQRSHVIPALIDRFLDAERLSLPQVHVWGSGRARRDFLHVDDLADAICHLLTIEDPPDWVNVGTGDSVSIKEVAETIKRITSYTGEITYDKTKPDGTPHKVTDITLMRNLGWIPLIDLESGLKSTIMARQHYAFKK